MPRKLKLQKYVEPSLPIAKLDNVPGPEAAADALRAHYQRVQEVLACHRYDDVIAACHWCCDMDVPLPYSKPDSPRGTRMFCSKQCANSYGKYQVMNYRLKPGEGPNLQNLPVPTDDEMGESVKPVEDEANGVPLAEITDIVGKEGQGRTTAWKPIGERGRKPRKARAKKPERTDGNCAKGKHKMTDENRYEYKGTVWCRECRKASRSKSNGNGK